MLKSATLNRA